MAPEILSTQGRTFILLLWAIMTAFSLIGANQISMDFSLEFFLIPDEPVTKFMLLNAKHFGDGNGFMVKHKVDTINLASEETQLKIIDFYEKM